MTRTSLWFLLLSLTGLTVSVGCRATAWAHDHASDSHDSGDLHFSHPLVAESPSPDTKVRVDYFFANEPGKEGKAGANRHTLRFEAEYAFAPWLSLEVDAPYTFLIPDKGEASDNPDNVEIGLKYANFTFAKHGLLLAAGLSSACPPGRLRRISVLIMCSRSSPLSILVTSAAVGRSSASPLSGFRSMRMMKMRRTLH